MKEQAPAKKPVEPPAGGAPSILSMLGELYTAVVCDVLDGLGFREQALPSRIRPLTPAGKLHGRVFTACARAATCPPREPYALEIAAIDAMQRDDVLIVDGNDDATCGLWGELLATACLAKGARGVVMTACTRDLGKLNQLRFPVFGLGHHPADSKGRVDFASIGEPVTIGRVTVKRGDYVLGDEDGVVIIPEGIAAETVRRAHEKLAMENVVRAELARGIPLRQVFENHRVL